jgi:putative flippase GtrA
MKMIAKVLAREAAGYALVSAVAFAADLACLIVASRYVHYLIAATLSFLLGGFIAYALSVRYVFRQRRIANRPVEATAFVALGLVGLAVNVAVIGVAVGEWQLPLVAAKLLAGCGTFASNFVLRRWALFSQAGAAG